MKKISIMVPCFNEEENVVPLSEANNVVNYVNSSLEYDFSVQKQEQRNYLLTKELSRLKKIIDITFLTKSLYDVSCS